MAEQQRELQSGDLVWADRSGKGLPYNHCGIYEGSGYIIHFASPSAAEKNLENAVVHRAKFEEFRDGSPVKVVDLGGTFSPEETVHRARMCIGMRGYNAVTFNCDHFATWCKTGVYRSMQMRDAKILLKEINNPVTDIVCDIHDIAEMFKASRLNTGYEEREAEILDTLETNAYMTETIPPVPVSLPVPVSNEEAIPAGYQVIVGENEGESDDDLPPARNPWYERLGDSLKGLTFPVAGALETLKNSGKLPVLRNVDFHHMGAKVRNVIDNIVTAIKVFTGRLTPEQAYEERLNNETALAGQIVQQKQKQPVKAGLLQVFGKIGSTVKHVVQQAITRFSSPRAQAAIKTGVQKIGMSIAGGIRSFWQKARETTKSFFGKVKQFFFS